MRLKKIKLAGFKSFVDPTTIALPGKLIGIVGPNGCGKSNVIDAVRWVMGESSAKHLRGDSMADVIFSGSTSRKPVSQASIELVFDNSDGSLGGQWASYAEIAVKRSVTRDGQSNYYLNGARCRRKDITDIFLGTGLGPRSYAIIEQGTISRLIEAKPEDLRIFIEEAAGISKYKERRRETETRIAHTKENLNRLNDLCQELGKRLQTLQRQATTAERYKELKQQERTLRAQLQALRWRAIAADSAAKERDVQAMETVLEGARAELRKIEAAAERHRAEHLEESDALNVVQGEYYALGAEIARLEQAIQHAKETRQQRRRDLESSEHNRAELQSHLDNDERLTSELEMTLDQQDLELTEAQERAQQSAAQLAQAEQVMHDWQSQWDEFNAQAAAQVRAAEVERTGLQHLEAQMEQLRQRAQRLQQELETLVPTGLQQEVQAFEQQREEIEYVFVELQQRLDRVHARIDEIRQHHQAILAALNEARTRCQALQGRHASLTALQEEALGRRGGSAVSQWLEQRGLRDATRLAQALTVEQGWERALETVLGLNLAAVCVEGVDAVAGALDGLQQGHLGVIDTTARPRGEVRGDAAPPLLDKVQAPWVLDGLLAGVYCVDDLNTALALRAQLAAHESVITRDGVWVAAQWLRVARGADEKAGVLARERELKTLARQLEEAAERIAHLEAQLEENQRELRLQEEMRDGTQRELRETSQRRAEAQTQLGARQARLEQMQQRAARVRGELEEVQAQIVTQEDELAAGRRRLHAALEATEGHDDRRTGLSMQRDEHRAAVERLRTQARMERERAHEIALEVQALRTRLKSTRENIQRLRVQLESVIRRHNELSAVLAGGETPLKAMVQELETQLGKRIAVEERLAEARRRVDAADQALREASEQRHAIEARLDERRGELDRLRLSAQELKVRKQTLEEQIIESGFEPQTVLGELPEHAQDGEWARELDRVSQHISRLGPINLAAIEEYAEQSERKGYLDAQHADLSEALDTLESAIRKIDKETRTRFQETFERVNSGFQAMFPRLFGGGQAALELTGEDLLETGVSVMARPPGKRNSTIHLLSGGEKALTAIALVFSIFQLNPAPFCMLDEVDAPLDEANVGRFCQMVKEMSEKVQFIYITHNKVSMEMAEQLLGVTMHEPGASRLVAVDVDDAVQLVAAG